MPVTDLRSRVAIYFAGFGAVLSLVMAVLLYQGTHDLGQRLIDETLSAELDDYIARRERNPQSLPPSTVIVQGYVQAIGTAATPVAPRLESPDVSAAGREVPAYLRALPLGRHDIQLGALTYRVAILERSGARYYLLYDTSLQTRRESRFMWMLGMMVLIMTFLSALGGVWLSRAVVAPVATLAARVRLRTPADWEHPLAEDFPGGEVGELARVFDRQMIRMRAFIERERAFSGDLSHELRTALAVILSSSEVLLEDENLPAKQRQRIERVQRAAREMAELATALLLIAREDPTVAVGGGCVVADVVQSMATQQKHMLAGKPVTVEVQTDPRLVLGADAGLVEILVSNLIRNAYAYTARGHVRVIQDDHCLIVSDTGKGIPRAALELVFVRHFRDLSSAGAGIGLSLVKRICDRYGWEIDLDSVEDRGTTVQVRFD